MQRLSKLGMAALRRSQVQLIALQRLRDTVRRESGSDIADRPGVLTLGCRRCCLSAGGRGCLWPAAPAAAHLCYNTGWISS